MMFDAYDGSVMVFDCRNGGAETRSNTQGLLTKISSSNQKQKQFILVYIYILGKFATVTV